MIRKHIIDSETQRLVLQKQNSCWAFGYRLGEEGPLLSALVAAASDPRLDFDWCDATLLAAQVGDGLQDELQMLIHG